MLEAFRVLEEEKHINKEDIIDAVVESLKSAYKRRYGQSESAVVEFNEKTGDFQVFTVREVVDEVFDSRLEISLKDALAISSAYELGDKIRFEESVDEFGRVAAQSAKQTIMEKMRKQMREITYNEYKQHEGEIMQGTVERFDQRFIYVNLGTLEAQLSRQDQIPGESFKSHDVIDVYVYKVENNPKGVNVFVSRSHPEFIKRIMEQEIPEVFDGTVEIMSVSREAGDRTKVAVRAIIRMLMLLVLSSVVVEATSRKLSAVSTQHVWMLRQVLRFLLRKILMLFNGWKIQLNLSTMLLHQLKWTMFSSTKMIANVRQ